MRNYFVFNGRSSLDFEIAISGGGTFASPERDVTHISVPGRNGTVLIDNGRYHNVDITYEASIVRGFKTNFDAFRTFLLSATGYQRLEDTYHPEEFRVAAFQTSLNPEIVGAYCRTGQFDITFHCKPQRFLKSGECCISITSRTGEIIINPGMEAQPIITVYGAGGYGLVSFNSGTPDFTQVAFVDIDGSITIDCETMNAYSGTTNMNNAISLEYEKFPFLRPGENKISVFGAVNKVDIIPRWWIL